MHGIDQRGFGVHHTHAAPTTTSCRLDNDRIPDGFGDTPNLDRIVGQLPFGTGYARNACFDHRLLGRHLVAHDADRFGRWTNELETAFFNALGETCVFAQKPVARVDRLSVSHLGCRNDGGHVQVTQTGRRWPNANRLLRQLDVLRIPIRLGIHHDCLDSHFATGSLDPQGDLATVGDQNFFKHASVLPKPDGRKRAAGLLYFEQGLAVFNCFAVLAENPAHGT